MKEQIESIKAMDNFDLAHFARQIHDQVYQEYYAEEEGLSSEEMQHLVEEVVRMMMRRNLVIPRGGTGYNLMDIAERLAGEPEFEEKYSEGDWE